MTKTKKITAIILIIIAVLAAASAVVLFFTPMGNRMRVPYDPDFINIADNIYVNKDNPVSTEDILSLVNAAKQRDREFFGDLVNEDETIIIICSDEKKIKALGGDKDTRTLDFPVRKHYISVSNEYLNTDILAHELTHSQLHTRLTAKALKNIPSWFDEGIATQNDYREKYSEENWIRQTENGAKATAIEDMDTPAEFYAGEAEDRRYRYMCAKHEVAVWMDAHGRDGLLELIDELNSGTDFFAAYNK